MAFKDLMQAVSVFAKKYDTEIAIGGAVALGTAAMAATYSATRKSMKAVEGLDITPVEKVKRTWKYWVPPAIIKLSSDACLMFAVKNHRRQVGALTTALTLSESAYREYQAAVKETVGEKKESEVRANAAQKSVDETSIHDLTDVIEGHGSTLFYDKVTGGYFMSDKILVDQAVLWVNSQKPYDNSVPLGDFYYALQRTSSMESNLASEFCIRLVNKYSEKQKWEVSFSSARAGAEGRIPCMVIDYRVWPV